MKNITKSLMIILICFVLVSCGSEKPTQIAATTAPVWQFTNDICEGTPLAVSRVVTESVSCLHDYTLTVKQMKMLESAEMIVISGADLEEFMEDVLVDRNVVDASAGVSLLEMDGHHHEEHSHEEDEHEDGHHHEHDPHIWLSPANAQIMARNICEGLSEMYPEYQDTFERNWEKLDARLEELQEYGENSLQNLSCRDLITFHDGFSYMAEAFDLHILQAIEEESGSEASAQELIELIELAEQHDLPAVFTEISGSASSAGIICKELDISSFALDMAMAGDDYFESMYHNIDTLKEALK